LRCIQAGTVPVDGGLAPPSPTVAVDPEVWPHLYVACPPAVPLLGEPPGTDPAQ
jgi:hypothetical protein